MRSKNYVVLHMLFSQVIGQTHIKSHLQKTLKNGRIPHAQLLVGHHGSGLLPMALAYANQLLCLQYPEGSPQREVCQNKVNQLSHPDLHFVFPVNTNDKVKSHAISSHFLEEWREFVAKNPYGSLFDWLQFLGIEKKQGNISVYEAEDMAKKMVLKSYEGGYKVMIIWMAEKMNTECANKILKMVEEPPDNTVLLLLTEDQERILTTIRSRCQVLSFPVLSEEDIAQALIEVSSVPENTARKTSRKAHGDFNKALHIMANDSEDQVFEKWFITWVRAAFKAKGNKQSVHELLSWSDAMAGEGRETQKKFLGYCMELFRQALLTNYKADSLLFFESNDPKFSLEKFAPFVHENNIFEIFEALEKASYHIERNGNAKIIFADLSILLTRLIHRKSAQ